MRKLIKVDEACFLKIYSLGENNRHIAKVAVIGTKLSYWIFLILFALAFAYIAFNFPARLLRFAIVPFIALLLNTALRKLVGRQRPSDALGIESRIGKKNSGSFPSNHSACSAVISVAFIWAFPPWGYILLPLALLTGLSRILSGVHYPLDVLCGFAVGALVGGIGFFIL